MGFEPACSHVSSLFYVLVFYRIYFVFGLLLVSYFPFFSVSKILPGVILVDGAVVLRMSYHTMACRCIVYSLPLLQQAVQSMYSSINSCICQI